jgi:hypothetical protein
MKKIYQFRVDLRYTKPPIWRRVQVNADTNFEEFHNIIQILFGWENSHLHSFEITNSNSRIFIEKKMEGDDFFNPFGFLNASLDQKKTKLKDVFEKHKKISYTYDFGANWVHTIKLEKELDGELEFPVCTGGRRYSLVEDSYDEFEEIYAALDNPESCSKTAYDKAVKTMKDLGKLMDIESISENLKEYRDLYSLLDMLEEE